MSLFGVSPFLTPEAYSFGIFRSRSSDHEGLEFPGFKASKVTLFRGFWGLRRQIWGFPGFKAKKPKNRKKREKTADFCEKSEKTRISTNLAKMTGFRPKKPNFDESRQNVMIFGGIATRGESVLGIPTAVDFA